MEYIIGIDGGGTKTALCAYPRNGADIGQTEKSARSPGINYNFVGVRQAVQNLLSGIDELGIPYENIAAIGIGDPSCDDYGDSDNAKLFIKSIEEKTGAPVFLRSDAYMALSGLKYAESDGVLIISGTGSIGIGETKDGKTRIVGGWGRLTGDEGSGYFIGLEGIRAALHAADKIAPDTELLRAARSYFDVSNPRMLGEKLCQEPNVAGFSVEVARCAKNGDAVAMDVLMRAAKCLADYAISLIKDCGGTVVGVYGSVLKNDKIVRDEFERILHEYDESIRITEPKLTPEEAAARYAVSKL